MPKYSAYFAVKLWLFEEKRTAGAVYTSKLVISLRCHAKRLTVSRNAWTQPFGPLPTLRSTARIYPPHAVDGFRILVQRPHHHSCL